MSKLDMSAYRSSRPRKDRLEELRQAEKFSDYLLAAWGIIELWATQSILRAYGLSSQNPKAEPYLNARFSVGRKLKLLLELGYLSDEDYQTVAEFRRERNRMFHRDAIFILHLEQPEKEKIMDMALLAVDVMHNLFASINTSAANMNIGQ